MCETITGQRKTPSIKNEKTKENISLVLISDSFTAWWRQGSRGFHHIQEVPPFGTISEFPHKGLQNGIIPVCQLMNSYMTSYHMNTCTTSYHINTCMTSYHLNTCMTSLSIVQASECLRLSSCWISYLPVISLLATFYIRVTKYYLLEHHEIILLI